MFTQQRFYSSKTWVPQPEGDNFTIMLRFSQVKAVNQMTEGGAEQQSFDHDNNLESLKSKLYEVKKALKNKIS